MLTTRRLALSTAVLAGGLLLATPAAAQEVDCATYPADCPIQGVVDEPATDDQAPVRQSVSDAASLPFTGGELTLVALAGIAAVGGGVAFTVAGRKRVQA